MKRKVFASEACCVMLANLRISGPPDDNAAAGTATTDAGRVPAGLSGLALAKDARCAGVAGDGEPYEGPA